MKQLHVKGMVIDGLTVVEDFPELNKRLRVATEGLVKILKQVRENFGTEKADYENYREEYQRLYGIVEELIEEYAGVENERIILLLKGKKYRMKCQEAIHKHGYQSVEGIDFGIKHADSSNMEIFLLDR